MRSLAILLAALATAGATAAPAMAGNPQLQDPILDQNNGLCDWQGGNGYMYEQSPNNHTCTKLTEVSVGNGDYYLLVGATVNLKCLTWNQSLFLFDVIACKSGIPSYQRYFFQVGATNNFKIESLYNGLCAEGNGSGRFITVHTCSSATPWIDDFGD